MFERFTDRARRVVVLSQEEARLRNSPVIHENHLFYAIVFEHDGVGGQALAKLGVTTERVSAHLITHEGPPPPGHMPFTDDCKRVLEKALREALLLGHNYIGTEHILLGMIRQETQMFEDLLDALELNPAKIRQKVIQLISGYDEAEVAEAEGPKWTNEEVPFTIRFDKTRSEVLYLDAHDIKNALLFVQSGAMNIEGLIEFLDRSIKSQPNNTEGS